MSSKITELRDQVFNNWKKETGPCNLCGICDHQKGFFPSGGAFNQNAPVMLVGHAPGESEYGAENRTRNYLSHPKPNRPELRTKEKYEQLILQEEGDWDFFDDLLYLFGDEKNPDDSRIHYENRSVLKSPRQTIYYTNFLKCSPLANNPEDVSKSEAKTRNNSGYTACTRYFERETESVDPEVIVIFGKAPWKVFSNLYDSDEVSSDSEYSELVLPSDSERKFPSYSFNITGREIEVIPTYHWSFNHTQFNRFDWYSGGKKPEFYSVLAEELAARTPQSEDILRD